MVVALFRMQAWNTVYLEIMFLKTTEHRNYQVLPYLGTVGIWKDLVQ